MARIKLKDGRDVEELGEIIVAAWWKALDVPTGSTPLDLATMKREIEASVREVVDESAGPTVSVLIDTDSIVNVVIPKWPNGVNTIADLVDYLDKFHKTTSGRHYDQDLGQAVLFGCGR